MLLFQTYGPKLITLKDAHLHNFVYLNLITVSYLNPSHTDVLPFMVRLKHGADKGNVRSCC